MTTTKTEKRTEKTQFEEAPKQEELRLAREIHTLAQMLYREMTVMHPWITPPSPLQSFEATQAWSPFMPGVGPTPSAPTHWPW